MEETRYAPASYIRLGQGTRLNGIYEIESYITAGGMGEIYKGRSIANGDVVAIKTVRPELGKDPAVLSLFKREASALHNLNHPAIVRYFLFSIDQDLGLPYLAMEYVDGIGLSEMLRQAPLTTNQTFTLLHRLASGLEAAHEFGIIHRDLSPDNVLIPRGEVHRAKIIDFGIARSPLAAGTIIGSGFAGKLNYVSPEQLGLFGGDVGPRSDIFSLGLVIAEAVRGEPLNMGRSHLEVINARRQVPDLSSIDKALRPLLQSMLQPNPKDRLASMAEVASRVPPGLTSDQQTQVGKKRLPLPPPEPWWRRPAAVAPLALVLLAAAGGVSLVALRPDLPSLTPPALQPEPAAPKSTSSQSPSLQITKSQAPSPEGADRLPPLAAPPPAIVAPIPVQPVVKPPPASLPNSSAPLLSRRGPRPQDPVAPISDPPPFGQPTAPDEDGSTTMTGRGSEQAPEQPPVQPVRDADEREIRSFIRGYDGGPCFYTALVRAGRGTATIEALGAAPDAFIGFDSAFQRTFEFEAQINLRQVAEPQCPVVAALAAQEALPGGRRPALSLRSDQVRSGGNVIATADARADKHVELLLVSDDGHVHSLSRFTKREGESLTLTLKLVGSRPEGETAPQLVVALASPRPLTGLLAGLKAGSVGADRFFRQLADESAKGPIGVAAKYFILSGGS